MPARSRSAPTRWRCALEQAAAARGMTLEIVRTGSRGLYWLEPMVEVATSERPHRLRPGERGRCAFRARGDGLRGAARPAPWRAGEDILAEAADAPHLCALRHHRSALARGLSRPWRLQGPRARADAWRRMPSSPTSRRPACAAAAAPAFRPASNGRRWRRPAPTANTSSATPMKATAAPSPTA